MTTLTTMLLDFLLNLLRDPEAAADFRADPEHALASAGLSGVGSDDVDAIMPAVLDCTTVNASSFDRNYNTGGDGARPAMTRIGGDRPGPYPTTTVIRQGPRP